MFINVSKLLGIKIGFIKSFSLIFCFEIIRIFNWIILKIILVLVYLVGYKLN